MAARWVCRECGSLWAPGAQCCPACRGLDHADEAERPFVPGTTPGPDSTPEPNSGASSAPADPPGRLRPRTNAGKVA